MRLGNFESVPGCIKGCALAFSARDTLLLPCFSNCFFPWFKSRCPLTYTYPSPAVHTLLVLPLSLLTQALLVWFWVGAPWPRVSSFLCAQGLPAAPYLISLPNWRGGSREGKPKVNSKLGAVTEGIRKQLRKAKLLVDSAELPISAFRKQLSLTLALPILKLTSAVTCKIILPSFPPSPSLWLCPWKHSVHV